MKRSTSIAFGLVVIGDMVETLPTATDDALGFDQWFLGSEVALPMVRRWGVAGRFLRCPGNRT